MWPFRQKKPPDRRAAMMAAIRKAAEETTLFKGSSLTDGLRCIRTFERVNGRSFDPLNEYHVSLVRGMGVHERIHRRVGRIWAKYKEQ